jgi:hypothetical protein
MADITVLQKIFADINYTCLWHFTRRLAIWSVQLLNGVFLCVFLASTIEKKQETKTIIQQGPSLPVITFFPI